MRNLDADTTPAWHALPSIAVLDELETSESGLTLGEAAARLAQFGRNELPAPPRTTLVQRFLAQLDNVLIYVLLASAAITGWLGHVVDTSVILGVVVINALIGVIQEGRAEQALEAIRRIVSPRATVWREGRRMSIDAAEVVPGDVLVIEPGDRIAADARLLKARSLLIDEAILTGESAVAEKLAEPVAADAVLGDRASIAFSGTLVKAGQGVGVVVATGTESEIGRIGTLIESVERQTSPLLRDMQDFARRLTLGILAFSAAAFAFATLMRGYSAADAFMVVVGMAVAAIPEGLPAVLTITMAIGVQRMAARNAIVRRLPAVETLGSVSVICSDKTGTLTLNEMSVARVVTAEHVYEVEGGRVTSGGRVADLRGDTALARLARTAMLCNDAEVRGDGDGRVVEGDPMEGALVIFARQAGTSPAVRTAMPRMDEIPFDAAHRYMATLNRAGGGAALVCLKGAPEQVVAMCEGEVTITGERPVDAAYWRRETERLAQGGHRVLALASRVVAPGPERLDAQIVKSAMRIEGLVGLIDPPRPEAVAAIAECRRAGVEVKMITGDYAVTAGAIAASLGIADPHRVATGKDIDATSEPALRRLAAETNVFARTTPEHKLRLIQAIQAGGGVVAMTGDGVNDAPALKRADVGVAMGAKGTEAAKSAAPIVLADDNFASIVAAIREGRIVYDNLTKVIAWTLPTSGGVTMIILLALLLGMTMPITPAQVLWINMLTAVGLGLVLAFEPAEPGVMRRRPRAVGTSLLSGFLLWRILFVSFLFTIGTLAIFAFARSRGLGDEAARTMVVATVVVMEVFYLFAVRYLHGTSVTFAGALGTRPVLIGVGGTALAQLAFTYAPWMQRLFDTRPIGPLEAGAILAVGVALLLVLEIEKRVLDRISPAAGAAGEN